MTGGLGLQSEMGNLQTYFYLGLLLTLIGAAILLLVLVGVRQVVPLWREGGHPVIAALTALVFLSVVVFLVIGTWATVVATFHVGI
jgi:hypothetical protein